MSKSTSLKIVTDKVIFGNVNIFFPIVSREDGSKIYTLTIIIPKSDINTISKINSQFETCKSANIRFFGGSIPENLKRCLSDGDYENSSPIYKNSMHLTLRSSVKPGIIDNEMSLIIDPSKVYEGCKGRVSMTFIPYIKNDIKGIYFGLNNVQKLEDKQQA